MNPIIIIAEQVKVAGKKVAITTIESLKYPAYCVNCGNPAPYGGYCSNACQREVLGI